MDENYEIWTEGVVTFGRNNKVDTDEVDYAIIGGGITGITAAYYLSKLGYNVALFEKNVLGSWSTCATTGFLTQMLDYQPDKYLGVFGLDKTSKIYKSHKDAVLSIENIIRDEIIECDFEKCPSYIYVNSEIEENKLIKLFSIYNKIGLSASLKTAGIINNKYSYIELNDGAKFNPMKYIGGLAKVVENNGGQIFEHSKIVNIENFSDFVVIETKAKNRIKAKKVLMATASLFKLPEKHKHHLSIYRTFVVEFGLRLDYKDGLYEDTLNPYYYFRIDGAQNSKRLIFGGADVLDVAISDRKYYFENIRSRAEKIFGDGLIKENRIWSGGIDMSLDLLPHVGFEEGSNIFYAYGFGGNGLTYSMTAVKIFIDEIEGRENEYKKLFEFKNR